jgi:hypothetical protein
MRVVDSLLRFNRYFFCSRARCRLRAPSGPNAGFTLNPKKFFFAQESVNVSATSSNAAAFCANPTKLKAIAN